MKLPKYVVLEKKRGQTPLETILAWKNRHLEYSLVPASYAGRLDPMAEGKLLVLLGNECKQQQKYIGLDKEYEVEVVLDLATDTGDALGIPEYHAAETQPVASTIEHVLRALTGAQIVPYPAFSSKTVNGKPLFQYTLEGTLETIEIPTHTETIYRIQLLKTVRLTRAELQERIDVGLVEVPRSDDLSKELGADFRQDIIRAGWRALFTAMPERDFTILRLRVACGSGSYMRTLAGRIGAELGTTGFALSINRTKIGTIKKFGPLWFWTKKY
ncbi:MAG: truB [Parcubacteria group bacterium]|nr:truB [Parcubacteria group bacterium]